MRLLRIPSRPAGNAARGGTRTGCKVGHALSITRGAVQTLSSWEVKNFLRPSAGCSRSSFQSVFQDLMIWELWGTERRGRACSNITAHGAAMGLCWPLGGRRFIRCQVTSYFCSGKAFPNMERDCVLYWSFQGESEKSENKDFCFFDMLSF